MKYLKWLNSEGLQIVNPKSGMFGFIYKITQISTGKIYIGKKNFWDGDMIKQSNWSNYTTSSKELSMLIRSDPKNYKAEIIDYAITSKQLGFLERKYQEEYNVFGGDDSFNKKSFYKYKRR